jgi:hypothetical protein
LGRLFFGLWQAEKGPVMRRFNSEKPAMRETGAEIDATTDELN